MTFEPFADGDDPDDAYDASDPIAGCLDVIRRRVRFVVAIVHADSFVGRRLDGIADDVEDLADRLRDIADAVSQELP